MADDLYLDLNVGEYDYSTQWFINRSVNEKSYFDTQNRGLGVIYEYNESFFRFSVFHRTNYLPGMHYMWEF